MTVTVTLRERGSNAFLELRSLFIPTLHTMYTVLRVSAVLDQVLRTLCPRL